MVAFSRYWFYAARMLPDYELIQAVKDNSVSGMIAAMEKGASLDVKDFGGFSLLEVAQRNASIDAGRKLLDLGCNPNQRVGKQDDTLLHRCVKMHDGGFTDLLLKYGADANACNGTGKTPLYYAKQKGFEYLADRLRKSGARVEVGEAVKVAERTAQQRF